MKSLKGSNSLLSNIEKQLEILNNGQFASGKMTGFDDKITQSGFQHLKPESLDIFQVNIGYMCNQTCKHCHVDAGPDRKEIMNVDIMNLCLQKIEEFGVKTVDITGGAPEMNPNFKWFVEELVKLKVPEIIVRSNLTILVSNPKYRDLPGFFSENNLRIVSSLPFYKVSKTDQQRGIGVFDKSIEALKLLNNAGYGKRLILDLVYNPGGAFLPPDQFQLERDYKRILAAEHDVVFNKLFVLNNLPINRFLEYLLVSGNYNDYMERLVNSFNPEAINGLMCRNTISIDYLGNVFDCDFNQMLGLRLKGVNETHLSQLSLNQLMNREIQTGQHCFGCTAGAGSSCQGSLVA